AVFRSNRLKGAILKPSNPSVGGKPQISGLIFQDIQYPVIGQPVPDAIIGKMAIMPATDPAVGGKPYRAVPRFFYSHDGVIGQAVFFGELFKLLSVEIENPFAVGTQPPASFCLPGLVKRPDFAIRQLLLIKIVKLSVVKDTQSPPRAD